MGRYSIEMSWSDGEVTTSAMTYNVIDRAIAHAQDMLAQEQGPMKAIVRVEELTAWEGLREQYAN